MRADRLLRLLMLLQRHQRATASWLAGELEVSERTVLRDMQALSAAGVPVFTEQGRGGGCVLLEGFTTQASGLTPDEAQAIFAWTARDAVADLGLGANLTSGLAKIAATAPTSALADAESLGGVVLADRRRWFAVADDVPALPTLRQAAMTARRVRMMYQSPRAEGPQHRTVDVVGVVDNSGRWYLVAEHRGELRSYRVSRISQIELLDEPSRRQDQRPLAEIWAELRNRFEARPQPIEVIADVPAEQVQQVRAALVPLLAAGEQVQVVHRDAAGGQRWRFLARHRGSAIGLALAMAGDLRVVGPADLVAELAEAARRAGQLYDGPQP